MHIINLTVLNEFTVKILGIKQNVTLYTIIIAYVTHFSLIVSFLIHYTATNAKKKKKKRRREGGGVLRFYKRQKFRRMEVLVK